MLSFIKRHIFISLLCFVNLIAIIAVTIVIVVHHAKTATVNINVAPIDATITLNGREYANLETYDVLPGDYHVIISMDKMQAKEYDIKLENNGYVKIQDYLLDSDGSFNYYLSHPEDEQILSEIASKDDIAAQGFIADYEKKAALLNLLPIDFDQYTDDYANYSQYHIMVNTTRDDCPKIACLIIEDNTGGNEEIAINQIRELGFNPEDYVIDYQFVPIFGGDGNE